MQKKFETSLVLLFGLLLTAFVYRDKLTELTTGERNIFSSALPKVLEKKNTSTHERTIPKPQMEDIANEISAVISLQENNIIIHKDSLTGYHIELRLTFEGKSLYHAQHQLMTQLKHPLIQEE